MKYSTADFILTGDLHLNDKPYKNSLERSQTLLNDLKTLSLNNERTAIYLNGDIFHDCKPSYTVLMLFWNFCEWCLVNRIQIIINTGNHDYFSLNNPDESYLKLFDAFPNVCVVWEQPYLLHEGHIPVLVCPWRPGKEFIATLNEVIRKGIPDGTILVAHQPITEGVVNASGLSINQDLSLKGLHPRKFKFVFLSDYHEYQQLSNNVFCIGAPIQHKFGDVEQRGVVGVHYNDGITTWDHIPLPSKYSEFVDYEIKDEDLYLPDYDSNNYNRIFAHSSLRPQLQLLYPEAAVLPLLSEKKLSQDRLEGVEVEDLDKVFAQFVKTRKYENKRERQVMRKLMTHYYEKAKEASARG